MSRVRGARASTRSQRAILKYRTHTSCARAKWSNAPADALSRESIGESKAMVQRIIASSGRRSSQGLLHFSVSSGKAADLFSFISRFKNRALPDIRIREFMRIEYSFFYLSSIFISLFEKEVCFYCYIMSMRIMACACVASSTYLNSITSVRFFFFFFFYLLERFKLN